MIRISKEQVIALHSHLISETGGSDGIRDRGLLESAMAAPFQVFGDKEAFPSIPQKAARIGYGIIKNHAFIDGNKRSGVHCMLVFLALNRIELDYTQDELSDIVLRIAASDLIFEDLLKWIIEHQL
ncbi:type II toxin-antitoxin system death-on-curing family toxin [Succinimonas amylolytica]|uniref:type II toxin-antitoxin system death-on-curing family toxin n=1 Tax=Succinimonas amylolytica TaxID=83769 RepID=UPI0003762497|nr:type II toxin-antitoxin system death-on-curing family toxin [Succinimonas amylolytica]